MSNGLPIDLFFCYRHKFATVAAKLGYKIGTRADEFMTNQVPQLLDEGYSIDFVDNHFEDPDVQRLHRIVKKTNPSYVVLPDVYDADDFDDIYQIGCAFESIDVTPIIVPKCDLNLTDIPRSWVIGFSTPSSYGGTDVDITSFKNHNVHLLGGSPKKQLHYATKAVESGVTIQSVDGNSFCKAARYGNLINTPQTVVDGGNGWHRDVDGYDDWGQRIITSLTRNYEMWRLWCQKHELL